MTAFAARARVLWRALPARLVALSTLVTAAAPQLAQVLPDSAETVTTWSVRVAAGLATMVLIVRWVTPAAPDERGLLPKS